MSKFYNTYSNTNQNHPLQQNSQNFLEYKKYVSIHSEDRDVLAYPNSAEFEIELPEDVTNISTMKLVSWAFPANYDTFSVLNSNIKMLFRITKVYNYPLYYPLITDNMDYYIYQALTDYNNNFDGKFIVIIDEGFYNPTQLVTELQNKFNKAVTEIIELYLDKHHPLQKPEFVNGGGYNRFATVYNLVSQKIWFGNQAETFELLNEEIFLDSAKVNEKTLCKQSQVPDFSSWGLPANLGLNRCNVTSMKPIEVNEICAETDNNNFKVCKNYVQFYYGDVVTDSDNGLWLVPPYEFGSTTNILRGAIVQFIVCPYKINIFGPAYIYMEISKYNCIDETQPYNISKFTLTTNETNGIVNSAFAKIPVVSTPLSQYYDGPANSYKFFNPPVERIRRLKFKLRYHNGELVNFGVFEYTFTLEFTTLLPMINRAVNFVNNI